MKRQLELNFDNKENVQLGNSVNSIEQTSDEKGTSKYDESTPYAFCAVILIIVSILF